ncbi:hypothetical protein C9J85_06765 [Haloferax sp. wsp5]|nr:hypothetical protein C9J85_06765 [Haloferax sp. wsp5]
MKWYYMASALNAVYLALVVVVGVVGTLFVASIRSTDVRSRWLELSSIGVVVLFLLALGVQFLA